MSNMPEAGDTRLAHALSAVPVELSLLRPDPRNARAHDERNVKAVMDSLREHGQRKAIVVQRKDVIQQHGRVIGEDGVPVTELVVRAGNATAEAAKRLGWTKIAAVIVDEGDVAAIKYALRDNRSAELAEWDLSNLGAEMRELRDAGVALEDVGWEAFEYKPLMEAEWQPGGVTGEDFEVPDKRVSLMFTREEWDRLKAHLGAKPTADEVLKRLGVPPVG